MTTRTTIRQTSGNRVEISYTDAYTDERRVREFAVRSDGREGYVREGDGQVCDGLCGSGNTLMATCDNLMATIRREYRAMRRHEAQLESARNRD
jgi:hypothetical protein